MAETPSKEIVWGRWQWLAGVEVQIGISTEYDPDKQEMTVRIYSRRKGEEKIDYALPFHRTEAGYPRCSTCDGSGCHDCTDPA